MSQIIIKNIQKTYSEQNMKKKKSSHSFTLSIDELEIEKGEFFGLIGPSGCGKTTLLRIIAGLEEHNQGNICIHNQDITSLPAERRKIGMVFQQPLLFPHLTIEQNVEFGLKMQKVPKKQRTKKVKEALISVGLPDFGQRYPSHLSGGQQQRVAIARALVCQPTILLMDEPFSALDPTLREEMRELMVKIHKTYEMTIVFVTHDREEAFTLFDRMAILKEGQILQVGSPQGVYEQSTHPFVAEFLGCKNIFEGKFQDNSFISKNLRFHLSHNKMSGVKGHIVLRPECVKIEKAYKKSCEELYQEDAYFPGNIEDCQFRQGFQFIKIRIDSVLLHAIVQTKQDQQYAVGEDVRIFYNPEDIWMIR